MLRTHEVMNVRDVMGNTPWKIVDELILGDYERLRAGRTGLFGNLQSAVIVSRWDGQDKEWRTDKHAKWHDRLQL